MEKLNEEQCKMVEDNHSLIYWYCHKHNLPIDEWYDLLAIELCNTVLHFDPDKGAISTYFKLRADGVVYKECKKNRQFQNFHVETESEHWLSLPDSGDEPIDMAELNEVFSGENGKIIQLRYEGYTQSQIAKILNTSQSAVSITLRKIKEKYNIDR